jgi:hypothetical protein
MDRATISKLVGILPRPACIKIGIIGRLDREINTTNVYPGGRLGQAI